VGISCVKSYKPTAYTSCRGYQNGAGGTYGAFRMMCANGRGRLEMMETGSRGYAWNKGWTEFEAPNVQGA